MKHLRLTEAEERRLAEAIAAETRALEPSPSTQALRLLEAD